MDKNIVEGPRHLTGYFMKKKQDSMFLFSKFVKRYFVFDVDSATLTYSKSAEGATAEVEEHKIEISVS